MSIGRRVSIAGLIVSLAAGSLIPYAASPAAASSKCVTKSEFKQVKDGWSVSRVARKLGTNGKRLSLISGVPGLYPAAQVRAYKTCKDRIHVYVDYEKQDGVWRVTDKASAW